MTPTENELQSLIEQLRGGQGLHLQMAVRRLGRMGDPAAIPALLEALSRSEEWQFVTHNRIIAAIRDIGGPEAAVALTGLLDNRNLPTERVAKALLSLGVQDPDLIPEGVRAKILELWTRGDISDGGQVLKTLDKALGGNLPLPAHPASPEPDTLPRPAELAALEATLIGFSSTLSADPPVLTFTYDPKAVRSRRLGGLIIFATWAVIVFILPVFLLSRLYFPWSLLCLIGPLRFLKRLLFSPHVLPETEVRLDGHRLELVWRLGPFRKTKRVQLPRGSRACEAKLAWHHQPHLVILKPDYTSVRFAYATSSERRKELAAQINAHLEAPESCEESASESRETLLATHPKAELSAEPAYPTNQIRNTGSHEP